MFKKIDKLNQIYLDSNVIKQIKIKNIIKDLLN